MGLLNKKSKDVPRRRRSSEGDTRESPAANNQQRIFQRNRTLTGSISNNLSSAHHRTDLESPRTQAHHLAIQRQKVGGVLLVVVAIATLVLYLLFQFTARASVVVSDASLSSPVDSAIYEKAINDYLGKNPIERLRFALNQTTLNSYLTEKLPEVDELLSVESSSIGESAYTLSMRQPVAGWVINNKQYFVDSKGMAFDHNYYANPGVEIIDQSGVGVHQGLAVASNRFLSFVGRVVALSKTNGFIVQQAIIPVDTTRQLEIRIKDVTPLVKLSIDRPVGEQVEDMSRSLNYLTSHGMAPGYIDVRVSGKAFYI